MTKKKYLKAAFLASILLLPAPARAGWPVFDVSKAVNLIVNIVQRYSSVKKHIDRVKEITEKINRLKDNMSGSVNKSFEKDYEDMSGLMDDNTFGKFDMFNYESAAYSGKTPTEVSDIFKHEFFAVGATADTVSAEEIQVRKERRLKLEEKVATRFKTKAFFYANGGKWISVAWADKLYKLFKPASTAQDMTVVSVYSTINLVYQKLTWMSLTMTDFEKEMAYRISAAPVTEYKEPEPEDGETKELNFDGRKLHY